MQTCPGFFSKSLLESPGNLLKICSVKFVDTLHSQLYRNIKCQRALFGHIAHLSEVVLANQAMCCHVALTHHWVGHHNPHGNVDLDAHTTAFWSKSAKILAFLKQTCGIEQSSMNTECVRLSTR